MRIFDPSDGSDPVRPQGVERVGVHEERRTARAWRLGTGTLACPACDAPVVPAPGVLAPADALACPLCDHAGAARDFLTMAPPTRPTRVEVRLVAPACASSPLP